MTASGADRRDGGRMGPVVGLVIVLGCALSASGVQAQSQPDIDGLRSGVSETLSLLSFGAISVGDKAAQVTQSGDDVHIQLPLSGFVAPANAMAQVVARPAPNDSWDVTAITLPAAGALGNSIDHVVSYTLGQQAMHGRFDPRLMSSSAFLAEMGTITLQSAAGGQDTGQSIERATLSLTATAVTDGRLDLMAKDSAANWRVVTREPGQTAIDNQVRHLNGQITLNGLDQQQAARLLTAVRAMMQSGGGTRIASVERLDLQDVLSTTAGLVTRFEASQTLSGVTFAGGEGNNGTIDRLRLDVKGSAEEHRLNAAADVALDDLAMTSLSADTAALLPHRLTARTVLAGLPVGAATALLQAAMAPNPDTKALQSQAGALLAMPGAKAAVESFGFDAGPLHVQGSARFVPRPNGDIGADIHITATGADALLAQAMGKPALHGALPMVFLAKGMGRKQGDSLVWDISLGGGAMTINGMGFGQPAGHER